VITSTTSPVGQVMVERTTMALCLPGIALGDMNETEINGLRVSTQESVIGVSNGHVAAEDIVRVDLVATTCLSSQVVGRIRGRTARAVPTGVLTTLVFDEAFESVHISAMRTLVTAGISSGTLSISVTVGGFTSVVAPSTVVFGLITEASSIDPAVATVSDNNSTMGAGTTAGIAIGIVLLIVLVLAAGIWFGHNQKNNKVDDSDRKQAKLESHQAEREDSAGSADDTNNIADLLATTKNDIKDMLAATTNNIATMIGKVAKAPRASIPEVDAPMVVQPPAAPHGDELPPLRASIDRPPPSQGGTAVFANVEQGGA